MKTLGFDRFPSLAGTEFWKAGAGDGGASPRKFQSALRPGPPDATSRLAMFTPYKLRVPRSWPGMPVAGEQTTRATLLSHM